VGSDHLWDAWNVIVPEKGAIPLILDAVGSIDQLQVESRLNMLNGMDVIINYLIMTRLIWVFYRHSGIATWL